MADVEYKVYWFDPGETTGYATGILHDGKMGVVSGQAKWNEFELYQELKKGAPSIIGYETFEYRNNRHRVRVDNVNLFPRNLIGVMNLYVHERASLGKSCGLYTQTPAQGKSGYNKDDALRRLKVYKIANPHANDAMRHLLYWFTFGAGFKYNTAGKDSIYGLA